MKSEMNTLVSIIIPTYNAKIMLDQLCLHSLQKYTKEIINYEIIVVDDASNDDIKEMLLEKYPQIIVLVNETNSGYVKSVNRGMKASNGKYILLLNNDIELICDDWLKKLVHVVEDDDTVGIVAPKFLLPDGTVQQAREQLEEVNAVLGACMLINRKLIEKIGYFDEHFSPGYFEEGDYCHRAWCAGFKVMSNPNSIVVHHHNKTFGTKPKNELYFITERNRMRFMLLNYSVSQLLLRIPCEIKRIIFSIFENRLRLQLKTYKEIYKNFNEIMDKRKKRCTGIIKK